MTNSEKIAEIKEEIARLQGRIEEIEQSEKKSGRWKPKYGEVYFCITSDGNISYRSWNNDDLDNDRYAIGDCFHTEEAAEFEVERFKVLAEMQKFSFKPDWNDTEQCKYFLYYDYRNANTRMDFRISTVNGDIHFESREQAQACIDAVGEDRLKKYYFRVKED